MIPNPKINIHSGDKAFLENAIVFIHYHSDGFRRRGLRINLIVKSDFSFEMSMNSYENQESTGKTFEFILNGNLPIDIWNSVNYLCGQKKLDKNLKHGYGQYMEDIAENVFKFNFSNKFIETQMHIVDIESFQKNANPAEMELIKLSEALHLWYEDLYAMLISK